MYVAQYLNELTQQGYSYNTIRAYKIALKDFKDINPCTFNTSDLMSLLSRYRDRSTVSSRQATIKKYFKWLYANQYIPYNPAEGLGSISNKKTKPNPISPEDMEVIMEAVKKLPVLPNLYFCLIADMGIRPAECLAIHSDDINWDNHTIILNRQKKERVVPFNSNLPCYSLLKYLSQQGGPLFTVKEEQATYDWAYYWWNKLMQDAGLDYTISQLRHSAITSWINAGVDIKTVKELAGHSLLQTTEKYAQL